jgi:hypothetical protein
MWTLKVGHKIATISESPNTMEFKWTSHFPNGISMKTWWSVKTKSH